MIDHRRSHELAAMAVDLDLEVADRRELDEHLAGCPDCRAYAAALNRDADDLRVLPQRDAPERVNRTVVGGQRRSRSSFGPLAAAVSVVALVILPLGVGVLLLGGFGLGFGSSGAGGPATIVPAPSVAASAAPSPSPSPSPTEAAEPSATPSASSSSSSRERIAGSEVVGHRTPARMPAPEVPWIESLGNGALGSNRRSGR